MCSLKGLLCNIYIFFLQLYPLQFNAFTHEVDFKGFRILNIGKTISYLQVKHHISSHLIIAYEICRDTDMQTALETVCYPASDIANT